MNPSISPTSTLKKRLRLAHHLGLKHAESKGIDCDFCNVIESYQPGSIHMYSTHQRLLQKNCKIWSHISYYCRLVSYLSREMLQIYPSPNRWYSRSLNNKYFPFSLWVGDGSKVPLSIQNYSLINHSIQMWILKYTPEHAHCYATFYGFSHST